MRRRRRSSASASTGRSRSRAAREVRTRAVGSWPFSPHVHLTARPAGAGRVCVCRAWGPRERGLRPRGAGAGAAPLVTGGRREGSGASAPAKAGGRAAFPERAHGDPPRGYGRRAGGRAWLGRTLAAFAVATLPLAAAGCTSVVTGSATAAPPTVPAGTCGPSGSDHPAVRATVPATARGASPARAAAWTSIRSRTSACSTPPSSASWWAPRCGGWCRVGSPRRRLAQRRLLRHCGEEAIATINVYTVRSGTPAAFVRARPGGRPCAGRRG